MFDAATSFSGGRASVKSGSKWGMIDRSGKFIVKPIYDFIYSLENGLARFDDKNQYGYLDASGRVVSKAR